MNKMLEDKEKTVAEKRRRETEDKWKKDAEMKNNF
jgi:hypothetical protein